MSKLFTPFKIGHLEIKNRFVRSATTSYWSNNEDGTLTDPILEYYEKLAKGDVGLIIKGHSYVSKKGKAHDRQSGLSDEKHLKRMRDLTDLAHSNGSKIVAQINHGGYTCIQDRATASAYETENWEARELSLKEIEEIIDDFGNAAEMAIKAGFDGVQIHSAHGYLNSQFMSDRVNKREDDYGGSLKNRARLLLKVYNSIREKLGDEAIIGVKINVDDFSPEGGMQVDHTIQVLQWLRDEGLNFAELSGGGPEQDRSLRKTKGRAKEDTGYSEATWGAFAAKIRAQVDKLPLILVDGIRSKSTMDSLLDNDIVDFISMSKPLINEPNLAKLMEKGQEEASCIDCFKCISLDNFAKTMLRCFHKFP